MLPSYTNNNAGSRHENEISVSSAKTGFSQHYIDADKTARTSAFPNSNAPNTLTGKTKRRYLGALFLVICCVVCFGGGLALFIYALAQSSTDEPTPPPTPIPPTEPPTIAGSGSINIDNNAESAPFLSSLLAATIDVSLVCNVDYNNGTCRSIFSYENHEATTQVIERDDGERNYLMPLNSVAQVQQETFLPGNHYGAHTFLWDCDANSYIVWKVRDSLLHKESSVVVLATTTPCPEITKIE